jgi:hypothetical protein
MSEWFDVRSVPTVKEARGPFTDTDTIETIEGRFEVDDEYIDRHGGYYLIREQDMNVYPIAADKFAEFYEVVE